MPASPLPTIAKLVYVGLLLGMASAGTVAMASEAIEDVKLEGAEVTAPPPKLDLANVRNETFQREATAWFDQRWGLRGYAVRTDNAIGVALFGESRTDQHAAVGSGGVLFTRDDLAYVNRAESPDETIELARRFAHVQTQLRAHGKVLLPIIAPAKTSFHREAIPSTWRRRGAFGHSDEDLYGAFVRTLKEERALFVDARALLAAEAKSPEDVFQKPARHWRLSAACRTLQAAIDAVRPEMPELGNEQVDCRTRIDPDPSISSNEFDIFRLLNTWQSKPKAVDGDVLVGDESAPALLIPTLFVGSSFVWNFTYVTRDIGVLSPSLFYYYDESSYDPKTGLFLEKIVPFTDKWRADTLSRRLYLVVVLETYLPVDGKKFIDELEKELSGEPQK